MKLCVLSCLICYSIFPHSLRAQEQVAIRNHYELYYGLDERLARGDTAEKSLVTRGDPKITKDKLFGLTLYTESCPAAVSTDPMDQFDSRGREIRQMSAERVSLFDDKAEHPCLSRVYFSGKDGVGYKITERLTISTENVNGVKFNLRF